MILLLKTELISNAKLHPQFHTNIIRMPCAFTAFGGTILSNELFTTVRRLLAQITKNGRQNDVKSERLSNKYYFVHNM